MFAKMVSMARTPEEAKAEVAKYDAPSPASVASVPTYPYGLCISLDEETMEKLGMDGEMPSVGEVMQFTAMAKVTSASINEREKSDGTKEQCCRLELQITDMGVPAPDMASQSVEKSAQRRKRFYGATMAADADDDDE
ncbi:capsid staple protein [Bradyrhizobium sp. RT9a]|uniref:capsid staple protein n=1 Tax=Bradyrhizobium sp. RT9a TaxID=3156384 RepID=UPI003394501D